MLVYKYIVYFYNYIVFLYTSIYISIYFYFSFSTRRRSNHRVTRVLEKTSVTSHIWNSVEPDNQYGFRTSQTIQVKCKGRKIKKVLLSLFLSKTGRSSLKIRTGTMKSRAWLSHQNSCTPSQLRTISWFIPVSRVFHWHFQIYYFLKC